MAAAERGDAEPVREWDASLKLSSLRAGIPGYRGDSFENISAYRRTRDGYAFTVIKMPNLCDRGDKNRNFTKLSANVNAK